MSRKDYEAIAHVLDANLAPLSLVMDFADMLSEDSERFSRQEFVKASTARLSQQMEHEKYMLDVAHGNR